MKRSTLVMVLCLVLAVAMGVGSTMAYLQDTDEDVNVMTLGSVYIEQIELERGEDGILQEYTQGQPLYPAVYDDENAWAPSDPTDPQNDPNTIYWAAADENGLIDGIPEGAWNGMWEAEKITNGVDKFVFVKNTGKSDAYIRTIFAFEADTTDFEEVNGVDLIHVNWNGNERFDYSQADGRQLGSDPTIYIEDVVIDGTTYNLVVVTYRDPVAPGEVIRPSLLQVGMSNLAGNEEVAQFGETFDILVVSQAVQTQGFADADTALKAAFGVVDADNNPWKKNGEDLPDTPVFPVMVSTADELKAALEAGEDVHLTEDIDVDANTAINIASGKDVTLNLNGHKISATANKTGNQELFLVKGNMTVKNGSLELTAENNQGWNAMATLFDVTAGGVLNMDGVTADVSGTDMNFVVHLNNWGEATLIMNNCDITTTYCGVRVNNSGYDMNNVTIKNSDFHGGRMLWVHNYTSEGKDDTTLNLDIYNNGNTSDNEKPVRFGFSGSVYYDINGVVIP